MFTLNLFFTSRSRGFFTLLLSLLLVMTPLLLHAAPGDLDPTFGGDGTVITRLGSGYGVIWGMALQNDGKMIIAGDFGVARLLATGGFDPTFGEDGVALPAGAFFKAAITQPDGKLVVAGTATAGSVSGIGLLRYNSDGSLDSSFDGDGKVLTDFGGTEGANALLRQPDGKLVIAGSVVIGSDIDFALARYNVDGSLDRTFDGDGKVITNFGTDSANALLLQPDGKLIIAGSVSTGMNDNFALLRYNADGSLDNTFDGDGKLLTQFNGSSGVHALALQADGKVVAAGVAYLNGASDFALVRYNTDGSIDSTFADDGLLITDFGSYDEMANAIIVQPDGKLVAAGRSYYFASVNDFALARYNSDGSLDRSFDSDGKLLTDLGGNEHGYTLLLPPNGKLVVGGGVSGPGGGGGLGPSVARYNSDGSLDPSFDGDGKAVAQVGFSEIQDIVMQADGKLVVAGSISTISSSRDFALVRYNSDGLLDSTFADEGKVLTDFVGDRDIANALVLQPDGKFVLAGTANTDNSSDIAIARYNADGSLDSSFDGDGKVRTDFVGSYDHANGLVLQPDGKLVVAGRTFNGIHSDFAVVRYNADGSLDSSFDGDGKVFTDFAGSDDQANALLLQPDGKLVLAGSAHTENGPDFALARYNADGSLDRTFDGDGKVVIGFRGTQFGLALVSQPDGKLVAVGQMFTGSSIDIMLVRYNGDGSLDTTFDGDGIVFTNLGNFHPYSLLLQSDGKFVVGGDVNIINGNDFALVRYNGDGSLDTTFHGDGKVLTSFGGYDNAYALLLQPDGKFVLAGQVAHTFALVRYLGDDIPSTLTPTPTYTPTPTPTICPQATPEPLWVEPVTSPTNATQQTITVYIGNGEAVTVTSESGVYAVSGHFDSFSNPARVTIPLLANTTHHLTVGARVKQVQATGCTYGGYTLSTQSDRQGGALVIVQQTATDTPVPPTLTPTPTPKATGFIPITLVKNSQPQHPQDFQFHGPFGSFKLDNPSADDGDTVANSITYKVRPGVYNFSEVVPSPWYLGDITCSGGDSTPNVWGRTVNVRPKAGEQIVCTFTNQLRGRITAIKYNDLNGNGLMESGEPLLPNWGIFLFGSQFRAPLYNLTNASGAVTYVNLQPNHYQVCELQQAGWTNVQPGTLDPATGRPCYWLTTLPGQDITLYFGNTRATVRSAAKPAEDRITISTLSPDEAVPADAIDTTIYEVGVEQRLFLPVVIK